MRFLLLTFLVIAPAMRLRTHFDPINATSSTTALFESKSDVNLSVCFSRSSALIAFMYVGFIAIFYTVSLVSIIYALAEHKNIVNNR